MPLTPPAERSPIHTRAIECRSYRRADGLFDIEGHLTDVKSYPFSSEYRGEVKAGEPVHDMWLRLTVDDDMVVREVEAKTDAGPYAVCPAINPAFAKLKGLAVGPGWNKKVRELLGGVRGCTHLVDLLGPMGTVTLHTVRWSTSAPGAKPRAPSRPPLNICHAWSADGEVVRREYPALYTGPKQAAKPGH
jgi:hypothetical protein